MERRCEFHTHTARGGSLTQIHGGARLCHPHWTTALPPFIWARTVIKLWLCLHAKSAQTRPVAHEIIEVLHGNRAMWVCCWICRRCTQRDRLIFLTVKKHVSIRETSAKNMVTNQRLVGGECEDLLLPLNIYLYSYTVHPVRKDGGIKAAHPLFLIL